MNLKKLLQKQAEKDVKNLLNEEDEMLIQQIVQEMDIQEKAEKPKEKNNKDSD